MSAGFRELTIRESLRLANIPNELNESATTEMLRAIASPLPGVDLPDPMLWTVQQRMLGVAYYMAHTLDDGPDFAIGDGKYSDFLIEDEHSIVRSIEVGRVAGDTWVCQPLLGVHAEIIEAIDPPENMHGGRIKWLIHAMAAQMHRDGEGAPPDPVSDRFGYAGWLSERAATLADFPEGDFASLVLAFYAGVDAMQHHFAIDLSDAGPVAVRKGGAGMDLPAARFPVHAALTDITKAFCGKPAEPGR